jgi:hypothetical protein
MLQCDVTARDLKARCAKVMRDMFDLDPPSGRAVSQAWTFLYTAPRNSADFGDFRVRTKSDRVDDWRFARGK